jgi:hypothetical protein
MCIEQYYFGTILLLGTHLGIKRKPHNGNQGIDPFYRP